MKKLTYILLALGLTAASCKKFVTIDNAPNSLSPDNTFAESGTATSAVVGLYSYYPTTYSLQYFTYLSGLLSNEMQYVSASSSVELGQFQQGAVPNTSSTVRNYLWYYPYMVIMEANLAITGLSNSKTLTASTQQQLLGESYFIRAYMYFHMVNFMGGVPLSVSSQVLSNGTLPRASEDSTYGQVISDLKQAESLLPTTYTGTPRTRVNKYAAEALLARVYLYRKDYASAIAYASKVIGATDVSYSLAPLATAFKATSPEVILEFGTLYGYSTIGAGYSGFGGYLTTAASGVPNFYLYPDFVNKFEPGDNRRTTWMDSVTYTGTTYYRIYKYKLATNTTAGDEYNVLLRLGEQYLIRAEAYAQQNDIADAQTDLNAIRTRAGLPNTTAATQSDLLTAIAHEREVELFGETGHRWFDLKRTGQANTVLSALKSTWQPQDTLMPIPYQEILNNPNLKQNPGY
jgi:starch-binding outer membrane protein, SusD/RagB family